MSTRNPDEWLQRVYGAKGRDEISDLYGEWAQTYDVDMLALGYLHPAVAAGLVGRHVADRNARILDAGVGTGLLGDILAALGYGRLSGIDLSEAMLAKAAQRGVYADLQRAVLGERLDIADDSIDAIVSTGVFTAGHAPASAFDELVRITRPGGVIVFTVSDVVWESGGFAAKFDDLNRQGLARLVDSAGPYRPLPTSHTESQLMTRAPVYQVK